MFLTRWSLKGKTADALYAIWQNVAFYPSKDDIEESIEDVIQIATQIGYPKRAQIMPIRHALPTDIHNITLNIEGLNDIKEYLIKVFENPRVSKAYRQSTSQEATVEAFSLGKFVEEYTTQVNLNNMSKLISKIDSLQTSFQTIQSRGPYKPKFTPHKGRHYAKPYEHPPNFRRHDGRKEFPRQNNFRNSRFKPCGRGRGGFQRSPNIRRPKTASKTPDRQNEMSLSSRDRKFC